MMLLCGKYAVMLPNSSPGLLSTRKSVTKREANVGKRKIALIIMPSIWGDGGLSVRRNQLQRFCLAVKVFKGKRGCNLS